MAAPAAFSYEPDPFDVDSSPPRPPAQSRPYHRPAHPRQTSPLYWNDNDPFRISTQRGAVPPQQAHLQISVRNPTFTLPHPMPSLNGQSIQTPQNGLRGVPFYTGRGQALVLNGGNARLPNTQSNANANPAPPRSELRVEQPNFSPQPPNHFTTHEEVENYLESTPDFRDFNWDTLQDEPPVPSSPPAPRRLFALDLQLSSPLPSGRTATNGTLGSFASQVNSSNATMPPKKRGRPSNSTAEPANKRTRVSASEEKKENDPNAYDLFGIKKDGKKYEEVDLVDVEGDEDYQATMKKREADKKAQALKDAASKPQKLATTQCIVCMDQMEGLTVTHCGHLFCSLCLHQALNLNGINKRSCPVCRSAIAANVKDKNGKQPRTGFFHIEVKLQSRKGGKKAAKV